MNKQYPLMIPSINEDDIRSVVDVLKSGMLVQGKNVLQLEKNICEFVKASNAIAVSNGTATMHLILLALGIGPGDEIIVPAFSYVATANVVELVGATPIFADIDVNTFNINTHQIETLITKNTKAILPVHEFGLSCDISSIVQIANKHNLIVIEDAACALGATENNQYVGSFGMAASFSFHPRKSITSGEGGIITTNNKILSNKLRALRNHGIDSECETMEFILAGFNYRMTDFQASLLNSQMKRLNTIIAHKQNLAQVYLNELNSSLMQLPIVPENKNHTWQTFHIILDETIKRDKLINNLKLKGIGTNYGAQCIPATKYYQNKYHLNAEKLYPSAYRSYTSGLALPMYYNLSKEDVNYISNTINKTIEDND